MINKNELDDILNHVIDTYMEDAFNRDATGAKYIAIGEITAAFILKEQGYTPKPKNYNKFENIDI